MREKNKPDNQFLAKASCLCRTIRSDGKSGYTEDSGMRKQETTGYEMVKTSSDQIPQQGFDRQNIARVPYRFYG